jgi:hypothetical protein
LWLFEWLKFVYDDYKLIEELDSLNNDAALRKYVWQSNEVGQDVPLQVQDVTTNQYTDLPLKTITLSSRNPSGAVIRLAPAGYTAPSFHF